MQKMKIVVTGPVKAGKSSIINYLDDSSLNVEALGRNNVKYTVGMDMGSIKLNGFEVFLFGTPGLLRFSVMRDVIAQGADGIIFVIDAADPSKDKEGLYILNDIRKVIKQNTPIIFLANKQDLDGARSADLIKSQNNLPEKSKIFGTSAKTGKNVDKALKYLINEVFDSYKEIIEILKDYESDIKGLAEKLNKNKVEMRDFLNSLEVKRFIQIDRLRKVYKVKEGLKNLV